MQDQSSSADRAFYRRRKAIITKVVSIKEDKKCSREEAIDIVERYRESKKYTLDKLAKELITTPDMPM